MNFMMDPYRFYNRRDASLARYAPVFKSNLYYSHNRDVAERLYPPIQDARLLIPKQERDILDLEHRYPRTLLTYTDSQERIYRTIRHSPASRHESSISSRHSSPVHIRDSPQYHRRDSPRKRIEGSFLHPHDSPLRHSLSPRLEHGNSPGSRNDVSSQCRHTVSPLRRRASSPICRGDVSPKFRHGSSPLYRIDKSPINRRNRHGSPGRWRESPTRHRSSPRLHRSPLYRHQESPRRRQDSYRQSSPSNDRNNSPVHCHKSPIHKRKSRHKSHHHKHSGLCVTSSDDYESKNHNRDGYEDVSYESDNNNDDDDDDDNNKETQSKCASPAEFPSLKSDNKNNEKHNNHIENSQEEATKQKSQTTLQKLPILKNYKLLQDPFITKGIPKLYRYEGVVPNNPSFPPVEVHDPRSPFARLYANLDVLDLPVPQFRIDENYVGEPPPLEVTICNLNDNIDKNFLTDMVLKYGAVDELFIYYHPMTNKHLGLARVLFLEISSAKECVLRLNKTSVMGKILNVFHDPFGDECRNKFLELADMKKEDITTPIKGIFMDIKPPATNLEDEKTTIKPQKEVEEISNDKDNKVSDKSTPSSIISESSFKTNRSETVNSDISYTSSGYYSSNNVTSQNSTPVGVSQQSSVKSSRNGDLKLPKVPNCFPVESLNHNVKEPVKCNTVVNNVLEKCTKSDNVKLNAVEKPPLPPVEDVKVSTHQLDLDTRIELLLKGANPDAVQPEFLQLVENGTPSPPQAPPLPPPPPPPPPPEEDPNKPLSRTPSPFLSHEIYLTCHKLAIERAIRAREEEKIQNSKYLTKAIKDKLFQKEGSISDDEFDHITRLRSSSFGSDIVATPVQDEVDDDDNNNNDDDDDDDDDDRMSLSSLSSIHEQIIEDVRQNHHSYHDNGPSSSLQYLSSYIPAVPPSLPSLQSSIVPAVQSQLPFHGVNPPSHPLIPNFGSHPYAHPHLPSLQHMIPSNIPPSQSQMHMPLPPLHLPPPVPQRNAMSSDLSSVPYNSQYYDGSGNNQNSRLLFNQNCWNMPMNEQFPYSRPLTSNIPYETRFGCRDLNTNKLSNVHPDMILSNNYYNRTHRFNNMPNASNNTSCSYSRYSHQIYDPHAKTINGVVDSVTIEMKQILKKDVNKKIIESCAFTVLESWWSGEENRSKEIVSRQVPLLKIKRPHHFTYVAVIMFHYKNHGPKPSEM